MGAGLAKAAVRAARGLDHAPARLYIGMAISAVDGDPKPMFYRGEEAMAEILGTDPTDAGLRAVRRALEKLRTGRYVESMGSAPGRTARHLLLDGSGTALTPTESNGNGGRSPSPVPPATADAQRPVNKSNGGRSASCEEPRTADAQRTNGGRSAHERRTVSVLTADGERPPKEERNERGGGGGAPTRTCHRHSSWDHDEPCRPCMIDRKAAAVFDAARRQSDSLPRRDPTCDVHAEYPLPCDRCAIEAAEAAS